MNKMRSYSIFQQILLTLLILVSFFSFAKLCLFEYRLLGYPYQWEIREGLQLNHGIILSEGKTLYTVGTEPPVVLEPYGPVNPYLISLLVPFFGKELAGPRLLSFGCFLLLQILTCYAVYRLTRSWTFAVITLGVGTFLLSWIQWLLLARPDSLGSLLLFLALFVHWLRPYGKFAIMTSMALIILAFFTKTYCAMGLLPIAASYLISHRDRKAALLYCLGCTFLLALSLFMAHHLTNGNYQFITFSLMSRWVEYSPEHLLAALKSLVAYFFPLLIAILYSIVRKRFPYQSVAIFFLHIAIGIPIFSFLLLNSGAETYYWYCIVPALTILGMAVLHRECRENHSPFATIVLSLLLIVMVNKVALKDFEKNGLIFPSEALALQWKPVDDLFTHTKGIILNDNATTINAIRSGRTLHMEGLGYQRISNEVSRRLKRGVKDIDAAIAAKEYALIINPENELPVKKHYRLLEDYDMPVQLGKSFHLKLYTPREEGGDDRQGGSSD
jgi:hypothetical protein